MKLQLFIKWYDILITKFFKITKLVLILILLICLPQINFLEFVNPTVSAKFLVFSHFCFVLGGVFIIVILCSKGRKIFMSKLDIVLFLWLIYVSLNRYGIQTDVHFSLRYMELLGLGVVYLILRNIPLKRFGWLLLAIIISGIVQVFMGMLQLSNFFPSNHSGFKLTGSFFNPGPYAGFLAAVWALSFGGYLFKEQIIERIKNKGSLTYKLARQTLHYIPLFGSTSIFILLPATHSRASWIAVIFSGLFLLEYRYLYLNKILDNFSLKKKMCILAMGLSIVLVGLFGVYRLKKCSSYGRLFLWKTTLRIIKNHPVFGVGFDRFKAHYMNYQADYFIENGETKEVWVADNTYYAFNEILQYVTENGLIGLIFLIVLTYYILKIRIVKQHRYVYPLSIACLLAIGVFALFSYPMQILPIKIILTVMLAQLVNQDSNKWILEKKMEDYVIVGLKTSFFVFGAVLIVKGIQYTTTIEQNFRTWKVAVDYHQYGEYQNASNQFEKAYPVLKNNGNFLMNYGKSLSLTKRDEKALHILLKAKHFINNTVIETTLGDCYKNLNQYEKAEKAYEHAAYMIPTRFYPLYLQAKLYEESGDSLKAIAMAKKMLKKEIKIPSKAIKEMRAEMKRILNIKK